MSAETIAARRQQRADGYARLPRWHKPFLHLAATTGVCVVAAAGIAWQIHGLHWLELLAVPPSLLFANFFEWWTHKHLMHRPDSVIRELFEKHTLMHHRMFHQDDMPMYDWNELPFILLPVGRFGGLVLTIVVAAGTFGLLLGGNVGWLIALTLVLYVLTYELMHLSYHLPASHPLRKVRWHAKLARHHSQHHDPTLMARANFSVFAPFADWAMGTLTKSRSNDK